MSRSSSFAPSAAWRAQIVPGGEQRRALRRKQKEKAALGQVVPPDAPRWTPWLVLLARVFGVDLGHDIGVLVLGDTEGEPAGSGLRR